MKCPSGLRSVTTMSVWSPAWISPLRMTCGASISGRVASSPTTRGHHARGCRGGDAPARDQLAVGVVQHGRKPLALLERPDHRSCARQRAPASSLTLAQHARPAAASYLPPASTPGISACEQSTSSSQDCSPGFAVELCAPTAAASRHTAAASAASATPRWAMPGSSERKVVHSAAGDVTSTDPALGGHGTKQAAFVRTPGKAARREDERSEQGSRREGGRGAGR